MPHRGEIVQMVEEVKMRNLRTGTFVVVVALLLVTSLLSTGAKAQTKPRVGGTIRVADRYDGASIGYPQKQPNIYSQRQSIPAIETLFRSDKADNLIPWLATGFKDNIAAKTITLTLRKGVKFHDGTDFNAEAVKWNLDQGIAIHSIGTEKFKSIDIVDDYTVRINLTSWDSTIIGILSQRQGMIISPTAYKKNGEDWCAKNPIGTGPFQFISWEKDVRTTYKKFDGYWQKGKPYLDRIEYNAIADSLTRLLSFRRGELDIALSIDGKDVAPLEKDGYAITRLRVGSGASGVIPDSANPKSPFSDVRIRQAAQHAIDNEAIVKSIFHSEAEPANQWVYKGHWGYNPSVVGFPYNPVKARQLLAEAGYPNGFKTKLLYRTNPQSDQTFTAVQGFLKTVGIDAELIPTQTGRYNQIAFEGGSWEGLIENAFSSYSDVAAALVQRYSGGGYYASMLFPDDYIKAIQNAVTAPDLKTKQKYAQEVMKLMIDKYCLQIVLYCPSASLVSQSFLHNHGIYSTPAVTWTPEDAWLEK
jgi:ABC-type transport system substrate-binding protein